MISIGKLLIKRHIFQNPFASIEVPQELSGEVFSQGILQNQKTSPFARWAPSKRKGLFFLLFLSLITTHMSIFAEVVKSDLISNSSTCANAVVAHAQRDYRVRVLLHESERPMATQWKVSGTAQIFLVDSDTKTKHALKINKLTIGFKNKKFLINNEPIDSKRFYLIPSEGNLSLEGKEYHGYLLFSYDAYTVYAMNSIDIEDYVCSVLRTESWPGWPLEVNKAFAIASRSYVIGVILNNKPTTPYHVKNTNKHQTYSGVHSNPVLKQAVEETKGMFLADQNNKPIIAMFDSCCGGVIPAHIQGVDFSNAPYLARSYACTYCKDCRMYNWTIQYPLAHLEKKLKKEIKHLKNMHMVKISKIDKAGLVQQISVKGKHATHHISGKKIYSLLVPKVKSFYFTVEGNKTHITFTGKGIGHHLGLCQWGAREMVAQGYDYKSVLSFYYPGTHFMRLS